MWFHNLFNTIMVATIKINNTYNNNTKIVGIKLLNTTSNNIAIGINHIIVIMIIFWVMLIA